MSAIRALAAHRCPPTSGAIATIALAALLVANVGCGSSPPERPPSPDAPSRHRDSARVVHWSTPVLYHGVEVRLELPAGIPSRTARLERIEGGDRLSSGDLAIEHRYQRFEVAGGTHYRFLDGSRVFLFRAPSPEAPWETSGEGFALVWPGNGVSPVVQEDRRDGSIVWHLARGEVERRPDGTIVHRYRNASEELRPPITLLVGREGDLLERRRGVR